MYTTTHVCIMEDNKQRIRLAKALRTYNQIDNLTCDAYMVTFTATHEMTHILHDISKQLQKNIDVVCFGDALTTRQKYTITPQNITQHYYRFECFDCCTLTENA